MAATNFDLLRQGLEALESLSIQMTQNAQAAVFGENTAAGAPEPEPSAAAQAPAAEAAAPMQPEPPQKIDLAKPDSADKKILRVRSNPAVDAHQLRRALILSEILAPPLALRRK